MFPFSNLRKEKARLEMFRIGIAKTIDLNVRSFESKLKEIETQYFSIDQRLERIENALKNVVSAV